jgi:pyridoxal phosphate enzyme (YggS family)
VTAKPTSDTDAAASWRNVKARVEEAARASGREAGAVTLVAVSKMQPWSAVEPVLKAGQRVFGENRVQEAKTRWSAPREAFGDLALHLIGPLQSNKAREAVGFFDVIETLDRDRLAEALADAVQKLGRCPRLYVEINTGEEPQKAGVAPAEADAFIVRARTVYGLPLEGLMCIPPAAEPAFPHFALLKTIAERNGLGRLSMGMSADFETAIRFGATSVRVGSAVFGERA